MSGTVLPKEIMFAGPNGLMTTDPNFNYDYSTSTLNAPNIAADIHATAGSIGTTELADQGVTMAKLARSTDGKIIIAQTSADPAYTTVGGDATLAANGTLTIANDAVNAAKLNTEEVTVTVTTGGTTGTATVTAGSEILGYYPAGNQDQFVDDISIVSTTLTVTLAAAATADNVFKVKLLKA